MAFENDLKKMEKNKTKPSSLIIAGLLLLGIIGFSTHTAMNEGSPEAKRLAREAEILSERYRLCVEEKIGCGDY